MGDPRRFKNKYEHPKRLWESERLAEDKGLKREYGLKSMKELWVMSQELKKLRREARRLLSVAEEERTRDLPKLMNKLGRLGILSRDSKLEQVLSLSVRDVLERRLQTRVLRKGLAKSVRQSRQLITHGFISVNGKKMDSPSYLVPISEDDSIAYYKKIDLSAPEPVEAPQKEAVAAAAPDGEEDEAPEEAPKELDLPPAADKVAE